MKMKEEERQMKEKEKIKQRKRNTNEKMSQPADPSFPISIFSCPSLHSFILEKIPWEGELTLRSDPWAGLIASTGSFYLMVYLFGTLTTCLTFRKFQGQRRDSERREWEVDWDGKVGKGRYGREGRAGSCVSHLLAREASVSLGHKTLRTWMKKSSLW